jgi:phosphoribosylglycinamide formyltransferase-1
MSAIKPLYKPDNEPMSVAVLVSGTGTNLVALYEEQIRLEKSGVENYGRIDVVFTNVPNCTGTERAREFGIPVVSLSSKSFFDILQRSPDDDETRDLYDAAVITLIEEVCNPDLLVLAGYRRRVGALFIQRYMNRILNIYPGDITKTYLVRGVEAPIQALRAREKSIKCTVFLARYEERFGPAIIQSDQISLEGLGEHNLKEIEEKTRKEGEWVIYPHAVHHLIAKGRVGIDSDDNIYIDGLRMPKEGYQFKHHTKF